MENNLTLDEEIDLIMNKKSVYCKCNPCTCSENIKEIYYQELKDILERVNEEYIVTHPRRFKFSNLLLNHKSII